jgi:hypothetical protein
MSLDAVDDGVAVWFLVTGSIANVALWFALHRSFRTQSAKLRFGVLRIELMQLLCPPTSNA